MIFNPFHNRLYTSFPSQGKAHRRSSLLIRQGELTTQLLLLQGSFLNTTLRLPLSHPSPPPPLASLSDCLIGVEWGSDRGSHIMSLKTQNFTQLAGDPLDIPGALMAHSLRSIGSAALNFCYVAQGALDIYWEIGCKSWDVAAGVAIVREAGGKVFGKGGKELGEDDLTEQNFCVIRAIGDTVQEKGVEAQFRLAREFFAVIKEWET